MIANAQDFEVVFVIIFASQNVTLIFRLFRFWTVIFFDK